MASYPRPPIQEEDMLEVYMGEYAHQVRVQKFYIDESKRKEVLVRLEQTDEGDHPSETCRSPICNNLCCQSSAAASNRE